MSILTHLIPIAFFCTGITTAFILEKCFHLEWYWILTAFVSGILLMGTSGFLIQLYEDKHNNLSQEEKDYIMNHGDNGGTYD